MPVTISHLSREYVRVPVSAKEAGVAVDPTADTVVMAFPTIGAQPATWYTASWETDSGKHYARCLIGPGGTVALPVDRYLIYVKATDNPEVPVLPSGILVIS